MLSTLVNDAYYSYYYVKSISDGLFIGDGLVCFTCAHVYAYVYFLFVCGVFCWFWNKKLPYVTLTLWGVMIRAPPPPPTPLPCSSIIPDASGGWGGGVTVRYPYSAVLSFQLLVGGWGGGITVGYPYSAVLSFQLLVMFVVIFHLSKHYTDRFLVLCGVSASCLSALVYLIYVPLADPGDIPYEQITWLMYLNMKYFILIQPYNRVAERRQNTLIHPQKIEKCVFFLYIPYLIQVSLSKNVNRKIVAQYFLRSNSVHH